MITYNPWLRAFGEAIDRGLDVGDVMAVKVYRLDGGYLRVDLLWPCYCDDPECVGGPLVQVIPKMQMPNVA